MGNVRLVLWRYTLGGRIRGRGVRGLECGFGTVFLERDISGGKGVVGFGMEQD
jgi:hypothetical protein